MKVCLDGFNVKRSLLFFETLASKVQIIILSSALECSDNNIHFGHWPKKVVCL